MKIYLVGGAVRDQLLGLPVKERDWVVVGATIEDMLKQGYQQVGKDFPVFLHPKTHEEYALARMERKVKPGYKGFTFDTSPDVSLEDDLIRRDLTINAMAMDPETQEIIDPYHGQEDLAARQLRHVSEAFAEDPVRILRVGRFLARYAAIGFVVAPETEQLMLRMTQEGEVSALVPERVWKELERAMGETSPQKFFEVLENAKALPVLFPELLINKQVTIDKSAVYWKAFIASLTITNDTAVRLAALMHDLPNAKACISALFNRYRLPNVYRELALLTEKFYPQALIAPTLNAEALLDLFSGTDIYRREARFEQFLLTCKAIAAATNQDFNKEWLLKAASIAKSVSVEELIEQGLQGNAFAAALRAKRLDHLQKWLSKA